MNRELNFRIWHKPSATMHNYLKAKFGPKGANITLSGKFRDVEEPTTLTVPNRDLEVMQFSGVRDRNGTAIFEGDIIEFGPPDSPNGARKRIVMEWTNRAGGAESPGAHIGFYIPETPDLLEVVGNIYENAELLN